MNIRLASLEDKQAITHIWKTCFYDDDQYINLYLENGFKLNQTYLAYYNEKPVAMLSAIKTYFCSGQEKQQGLYLYALATLPEYQKKGIMSKIEEYIVQESQNNRLDFLCLTPATIPLVDYYQKRGYNPCIYKTTEDIQFESNRHTLCAFGEITKETFLNLRSDMLASKNSYFCFEEEMNQYVFTEMTFNGCKAVKGTIESDKGYIVYYVNKEQLVIRESSFSFSKLKKGISYLQEMVSATNTVVQKVVTNEKEGNCFLMIKPLKKQNMAQFNNAYMNFVLD